SAPPYPISLLAGYSSAPWPASGQDNSSMVRVDMAPTVIHMIDKLSAGRDMLICACASGLCPFFSGMKKETPQDNPELLSKNWPHLSTQARQRSRQCSAMCVAAEIAP